jgi:hypothetical protein
MQNASKEKALKTKLFLRNADFFYSALKEELILYSLHTVLYRIVYIIMIRSNVKCVVQRCIDKKSHISWSRVFRTF